MSKNREPIRVGDLAYVSRTCCNVNYEETGGRMGYIVWVADKTTYCSDCGTKNYDPHASIAVGRAGVPTTWLKRIDPPPLFERSTARRAVPVST